MMFFLASAVFQSTRAFTIQRESPWIRNGVALENVNLGVTLENTKPSSNKSKEDG